MASGVLSKCNNFKKSMRVRGNCKGCARRFGMTGVRCVSGAADGFVAIRVANEKTWIV